MNYEKYTFDELKIELGQLGSRLRYAVEKNNDHEMIKLAKEISNIYKVLSTKQNEPD